VEGHVTTVLPGTMFRFVRCGCLGAATKTSFKWRLVPMTPTTPNTSSAAVVLRGGFCLGEGLVNPASRVYKELGCSRYSQ